jgi:hypothetical protein
MKWLRHFEILLAFAAHILVATGIFGLVVFGAFGVHHLRLFLEHAGVDHFMLLGLHALEILLFVCDFAVMVFWAVMSTLKTIKELK